MNMASGQTVRVQRDGVCVFLLIVLAALHHTVNVEARILDMAPDAVDDDFSECRDRMLNAVTGGLLEEELSADEDFAELWRKHSGVCKKTIPGGTSHHITALQAYGNSKPNFRTTFNRLVSSKGNNSTTYRKEFPFKSLHFLLTDSLRLLNPTHTCNTHLRTVYSTSSNTYSTREGVEIRFGKFLPVENKRSTALENLEDGGTLFIITSCSVVMVENYTCESEELQSLVSPAEVFKVQEVRESRDNAEVTEITLKHSQFLNKHHCSFFPSNAAGVKSPSCLTRLLLALMSCLLFTVTP